MAASINIRYMASGLLSKIIPAVCGALITISISFSSWTMKEVVDLRSRVAKLESTHVGPDQILGLWKEIGATKEAVVKNSEKINALPLQGPPPWFIEQMKQMETRMDFRLNKLETKIDNFPKN